MSENIKTVSAFIKCYQNGNLEINGGLIFHDKDYTIWIEGESKFKHLFIPNHIITFCPKWWELIKWWNLIREIHKYTRKNEETQ